jgi:hypothetical protein
VRTSITRSDIRIDGVSHALRALVAGEEVHRCCVTPPTVAPDAAQRRDPIAESVR